MILLPRAKCEVSLSVIAIVVSVVSMVVLSNHSSSSLLSRNSDHATSELLKHQRISTRGGPSDMVSCAGKVFEGCVPEGELCYRKDHKTAVGVSSVRQSILASCPNTNSHVLVLLVGDSTLRNKWEYVKKINGSTEVSLRCVQCGMTVCYATHTILTKPGQTGVIIKGLLTELPSLSTYTVSVTVINFGLHHLHLYPARNIFRTSVPEFERLLREDVVLTSHILNGSYAWNPFIYFKLINDICTDNFIGEYAETHARWIAHAAADSIRDNCYARVQKEINTTSSDSAAVCEKLTFDSTGVGTINTIALRVAQGSSHLRVLDDRKLTRDRCACSSISDGRHYAPLVPLWWHSFQEVIEGCVLQRG